MTLVASVPRRLPRPLPGVFWVTVVAFGLHLARDRRPVPRDDQRRALDRGGRGEGARGIGTDRCRPLSVGRLAQTGLGCLVRAGRLRLVARGMEQPGHGRGSGVHGRTRRLRDRTRCCCPRGPGLSVRSPGVATGTPDHRRCVLRHGAGSRSTCRTVLRTCGASVPSLPAKPAARPRQPGVLRRSAASRPLAAHRMDRGIRRAGAPAAVPSQRPDPTPDGSGPGRRLCVRAPGSRGRSVRAPQRVSSGPARSRPGCGSLRPPRSALLVSRSRGPGRSGVGRAR